jgi:1,4-dihydroxy-2-naphthoate octaprenyltransferase
MSTATIHLDPVGRIRSLDPAAEALLGLRAVDVVAKERVAVLVPGAVALEQLPGWLATAASEGSWEGDALCRHSDGHPLPCRLRFTATVEDGRPTGFVQELSPLEGVDPVKRAATIVRLPFVTASVLPALLGLAVAAWAGVAFSWIAGVLVVLSVALLQLGSNTINDWFDWKSGTDKANKDYVAPFSGGSRTIELGLISEGGMLRLALALFTGGLAAGLAVLLIGSVWLLAIGLAGAALAFFYSVGPVRLVARRGLGELAIFLAFGPLITLAGYAAGGASLAWAGALVGVPAGLWTTGILWVNQIPDCEGDRASGKWNLVATLGRRDARWGLPILLGAGHLATVLLVVFGLLPWAALVSLLALPLLVQGTRVIWAHAEDDGVIGACAATVQHQLAAGLLSFLGVLGATLLG